MLEIFRRNVSGHLVNKVSTFLWLILFNRNTYFNIVSNNSSVNKIGLLDLKSEILWVTELQKDLAFKGFYNWFGETHQITVITSCCMIAYLLNFLFSLSFPLSHKISM